MKYQDNIWVTKPSLPLLQEYVQELQEIWHSYWLTNMGEKHQVLQQSLQDYLGVSSLELLVNGHMALELVLQAFCLRGEVITTPFTFASTTHAIIRNGLEPVFCDIDAENYTMDVSKLEDLITDRTSAILPVHVYGNVCDVDEIERIAKKYNLKVIYDAAHAFGEKYHGHSVADFGDAACLSFHATKVFHTIEGGAVCYHDEAIGQAIYNLKNFGIRDQETVVSVGANAKMNEFCAAMGICNLRHVDEEMEKRKQVTERYRERLAHLEGVHLPVIQHGLKSNYAYFPVLFEESHFGASRNEVFDCLMQNGIMARKYFYPLTSAFSCFHGKYDLDKTPVARYVSNRILTLPLYSELSLASVDRICEIICSMKK